ncbi:MAG: ECF transporter S component [Oscillospiraceae bacterium]|nr:ECF transporter S component [Oscillospiraceae bacterium]
MEKMQTKKLTLTALLLGMNVIMSSSILSVPVPGGHMYLNDVIIVMAALILDPVSALIVGGIGAFLGDLLFYPTPMFVSLVTHGLQAALISLFVRRVLKSKPLPSAILASVLGLIVTVTGYTFGRAFIYGTPEYAVLKFPFQVLQTAVGSAIALALYFGTPIRKIAKRELQDAV